MSRQRQKHEARLHRQIDAIGGTIPPLRGPLAAVRRHRYRYVRVPVSILLILGSVLAILPFFGLWMLPVGLALLALDVPALQPTISALSIRLRQRLRRSSISKRARPRAGGSTPRGR